MKTSLVLAILTFVSMTCQHVSADVAEIEGNDDFANAQVLPAGELVVTGELAPDTFILSEVLDIPSNPILAGTYNAHNLTGLTGSTTHFAETYDNGSGPYDTVLLQYDTAITTSAPATPAGTIIGSNDDLVRPFSGLQVTTTPAGDLYLLVTEFDDNENAPFGDHTATGDYGLRISESVIDFDGGRADFFKFSNLVAGTTYTATTSGLPNLDTILGLFDASGNLALFNDDNGGLISSLEFVADASGEAVLAVSGFEGSGDEDFSGDYDGDSVGNYTLTLTASVPEPSSMVVVSLIGLAGLARRKRA